MMVINIGVKVSLVYQVTPDFPFTLKIINYFTFSENIKGCLFIENLDDYHICTICQWDSDCQNDTKCRIIHIDSIFSVQVSNDNNQD